MARCQDDQVRPTLAGLLNDGVPPREGESLRRAASRSPYWVIALALHVIVFAGLSLFYFAAEPSESSDGGQLLRRAADPEPPIDETPAVDREALERADIPSPEVGAEVLDELTDFAPVDAPINEFAVQAGDFGDPEAPADERPEHWEFTASHGGIGKGGAIGIGGGSGPGAGPGRGHWSAGARIDRKRALPPEMGRFITQAEKGMAWLKRHQSPDGSFEPAGFGAQCDAKLGAPCDGRGNPVFVAGTTGLALLTFLGAGFDSQAPSPYMETVKKGLKWLRQNQDSEGCFGPRTDSRFTYAHACATLAMCEAYASTRHGAWRKAAQAGLDFIHQSQNTYKAWRYGVRPGDNDTSVTGWMLMALKSGKDAGLTVSDRAMQEGLAFIDSLTDEATGRTGYTKKGEPPVRPEGLQTRWPGTESEALTAVALCSRIFCGTAADSPLTKAGAEILGKRLPVWDESGGKIDMYYWYYGTLAMHQLGGARWDAWNNALKAVVVGRQCADGCLKGSFDTADPWCADGGRIYSTAIMTLCLEVYYRYPRVFGARTGK